MQYLALSGKLKDFVPGRCAPQTDAWPPVGAAYTWYWGVHNNWSQNRHPISADEETFVRLKPNMRDIDSSCEGLRPERTMWIGGGSQQIMICIDASFEEAE